MATDQPSFSPRRKWGIALNVLVLSVVVLAVMVMLNCVSGRYFKRFHLSTHTRIELSPRTLGLLRSITNKVQVTVYYDEEEPLYSDVADLLREYRSHNPGIALTTVDYYRNPAAAQETRVRYQKEFSGSTNKNFVIFESGGNVKMVDGKRLADYKLEPVANPAEREFRRKPVAFNGEVEFTEALLSVTSVRQLKAYFLQNHGEPSMEDAEKDDGFQKLALLLKRNGVDSLPLPSLLGTNSVPLDCNLLVITGPTAPLADVEAQKIDQYLAQGGRLFALFNRLSVERDLGL